VEYCTRGHLTHAQTQVDSAASSNAPDDASTSMERLTRPASVMATPTSMMQNLKIRACACQSCRPLLCSEQHFHYSTPQRKYDPQAKPLEFHRKYASTLTLVTSASPARGTRVCVIAECR
jgi:hypothetical protein